MTDGPGGWDPAQSMDTAPAPRLEQLLRQYGALAPELQWSFLCRIREELLARREAGELERERFSRDAWRTVREILDSPVRYYRDTGKKYALRPVGEALPRPAAVRRSSVRDPAVSIVIPAWNAAETVERCLESARNQTLRDIEIVCVDDGSSDETLALFLKHASADNRITVLHQENMGLSVARNNGLSWAGGKYVQFLDSDDELTADAMERCVSAAEENGLDILYFDGRPVYEPEELQKKYPAYLTAYEYHASMPEPVSGAEYFRAVQKAGKYRVSACFALFRAAYLRDSGCRFMEGVVHEDNPFTFETMLGARRVLHTEERFYLRHIHEHSLATGEKTFLHLYGMLAGIRRVMELAEALPYGGELNECAAKELRLYRHLLQRTYGALEDPEACRRRLTATELFFLDALLAVPREQAELQIGEAARTVKRSASYRLGRLLLWLPGRIRNAVRAVTRRARRRS